MKTRKLGSHGPEITRIGFGAWAIGGGNWKFGWGTQSDADSLAAIHRALELGMNWIDTAAAYGLGHSEELVGKALREWSGPRPYLFTKCGIVWNENREIRYSTKAASIRKECEASLRRLGVETIDLYQLHWPADSLAETREGFQELVTLREEGKIRWIGVSNFNVEELEEVSALGPLTSLQPPYSLIRRESQEEVIPWCRERGVGVIVYSPMGSGMLTGAMNRERIASLPPGDWRHNSEEFQEPKLSQNLAIAERVKRVASRLGCTPGEVAIAWTLCNRGVTAAIVGGRNPRQVEGIIRGADLVLSEEEVAELEG